MKRVGIFGGSFNPIHMGHIALAQSILRQTDMDEVWLMVSPQNPLKRDRLLLDDRLRLSMARTALKGIAGVRASDYEFQLPKPSYTWNTLQHLSNDYPDHEFILIIGGDNWAHFEQWRHWKDILRCYRVVVYPRGQYAGTIDCPLLDVSSTEIRQRVAAGESIAGLVPESIRPLVCEVYRDEHE